MAWKFAFRFIFDHGEVQHKTAIYVRSMNSRLTIFALIMTAKISRATWKRKIKLFVKFRHFSHFSTWKPSFTHQIHPTAAAMTRRKETFVKHLTTFFFMYKKRTAPMVGEKIQESTKVWSCCEGWKRVKDEIFFSSS